MSDPHPNQSHRNGDTDDSGPRPASGGNGWVEAATYGHVVWVVVLAVGAFLQSPLVVAASVVLLVAIEIALVGPLSRPSRATLTDADSWIRLGWVVEIYAAGALIYFRNDTLFWVVFAWFWLLQLADHRSWVLTRLGMQPAEGS